jgi:hypothetical protein
LPHYKDAHLLLICSVMFSFVFHRLIVSCIDVVSILLFFIFTSVNFNILLHVINERIHSKILQLISHNVWCFNQDVSFCPLPITQFMLSKTCYIFGFLIYLIIGYKSLCIPLYFNNSSTVKFLIKLII